LRRGSPRLPHKVSLSYHTKSEGRRQLPEGHLGPKASAHLVHLDSLENHLTRQSYLASYSTLRACLLPGHRLPRHGAARHSLWRGFPTPHFYAPNSVYCAMANCSVARWIVAWRFAAATKHPLSLSKHYTHSKHVKSLWMSNLALEWLGYNLQSVLVSSALPHNPTTPNDRVEGL
jgi:hypothetical protein